MLAHPHIHSSHTAGSSAADNHRPPLPPGRAIQRPSRRPVKDVTLTIADDTSPLCNMGRAPSTPGGSFSDKFPSKNGSFSDTPPSSFSAPPAPDAVVAPAGEFVAAGGGGSQPSPRPKSPTSRPALGEHNAALGVHDDLGRLREMARFRERETPAPAWRQGGEPEAYRAPSGWRQRRVCGWGGAGAEPEGQGEVWMNTHTHTHTQTDRHTHTHT